VLTEAQVVALEKAKTEKEAHGEFESEHPGYCGAHRQLLQAMVSSHRSVSPARIHRLLSPNNADCDGG
jgi:hypothetical protein